MSRDRRYALLACTVACLLAGHLAACRSVEDTQSTPVQYMAYGETWKYFTVEHYIRRWGLDSSHGMFGLRERIEQDVYLVAESGEKIDVPRRIVALQNDGSYRPITCCDSLRTRAKVYNLENRLVLTFEQTAANTTDCVVFPPGRPDDAARPEGEQVRYAILFGEFDTQAKLFRMKDFFAGGISSEEYTRAVGANPTLDQVDKFFYAKRQPFACNRKRG